MYANLTTGECVWDPPEVTTIRKTKTPINSNNPNKS